MSRLFAQYSSVSNRLFSIQPLYAYYDLKIKYIYDTNIFYGITVHYGRALHSYGYRLSSLLLKILKHPIIKVNYCSYVQTT